MKKSKKTWFAGIFLVYVLSNHLESVPRDGRVLRLHVKEGYFFTPSKRVTPPIWVPPPHLHVNRPLKRPL